MTIEQRLAEVERKLEALEAAALAKSKVEVIVHIDGARGEEHIRALSRQGAQQAIHAYRDRHS